MQHLQTSELKKHGDASRFLTLIIYILYGISKRFEVGIPFTLLIIFGGLNLLYALWVLYHTIRQKRYMEKYRWALTGSIITATVAAGLTFLAIFLENDR